MSVNDSLVIGSYCAGNGYAGPQGTYMKFETNVGIKLQGKVDLQRVAKL